MSGWRRLAAVSGAGLLLCAGTGCSSDDRHATAPLPRSSASSSRAAAVRGVVTAVTDASLTVRGEDAKVHVFRFGLKTKVRRGGADASVADLHVGDRVAVFGGTGEQAVRRIVIRGGTGAPTSPDPTGGG